MLRIFRATAPATPAHPPANGGESGTHARRCYLGRRLTPDAGLKLPHRTIAAWNVVPRRRHARNVTRRTSRMPAGPVPRLHRRDAVQTGASSTAPHRRCGQREAPAPASSAWMWSASRVAPLISSTLNNPLLACRPSASETFTSDALRCGTDAPPHAIGRTTQRLRTSCGRTRGVVACRAVTGRRVARTSGQCRRQRVGVPALECGGAAPDAAVSPAGRCRGVRRR